MYKHVKGIATKIYNPDFQNNFWTLLASVAATVYITLMVFIAVRVIGLAEAGMLSFAAAVAGLANVVVLFGVRAVQSTDINQEFSLNSYVGLRVCSALFASVSILVFLLLGRVETARVLVILLVYFVFLTDGVADVFMGDLQQKGKMCVAGRMRVCAFGSSFVSFAVTSFITRSLVVSLILAGVTFFVTYIIWIWAYRKHFRQVRMKFDMAAIKSLSWTVLPWLMATVIYTFLLNAPKYYLGILCSDESVAVFSMLVMPIAALSTLCSSFFMGAEMTKTAKIFASNYTKDTISRRINSQLLLAVAFSVAFLLSCFTFGIPLLSLVFDTDLSPYVREFMLLALGGVSFSIIPALGAGMLVLRMQKANLTNMAVVAAISGPIMWFLVSRHGITGAAFSNLVIFVPFAVANFVAYRFAINKFVK